MTLKEAAEIIKRISDSDRFSGDERAAIEMAIKALDNLRLICANAYIIEKLVREVTDYE